MTEVDGYAADYQRAPISSHDARLYIAAWRESGPTVMTDWMPWAALAARIRRVAQDQGVTFRAGPQLMLDTDPVGITVRANADGTIGDAAAVALRLLTEEAIWAGGLHPVRAYVT